MDEKRRRFEALAMPHLDAAYNLARWLARGDADDIVQEAMLRAFKSFDGFRGEAVKPWLLAIVRNCHLTALEQKKRQVTASLDEIGDVAAPEPTPESQMIGKGTGQAVTRAIAALPEEFREVTLLREMEDMSYREIAIVTATPIGTVMSRLARGRALLKKHLEGGGHGL